MEARLMLGLRLFWKHPATPAVIRPFLNTIGFITEAHMIKPYEDRVEATRAFLHSISDYMAENALELQQARQKAFAHDQSKQFFALQWTLDSSQVDTLVFKGYEAQVSAQ
ncbi:MAG: hypothetical protein U5L96_13185 [Owenweeksia sp.]|nr:hypothetical protein [Owenweeksia sp.]